jgi:hypothetical protein
MSAVSVVETARHALVATEFQTVNRYMMNVVSARVREFLRTLAIVLAINLTVLAFVVEPRPLTVLGNVEDEQRAQSQSRRPSQSRSPSRQSQSQSLWDATV